MNKPYNMRNASRKTINIACIVLDVITEIVLLPLHIVKAVLNVADELSK